MRQDRIPYHEITRKLSEKAPGSCFRCHNNMFESAGKFNITRDYNQYDQEIEYEKYALAAFHCTYCGLVNFHAIGQLVQAEQRYFYPGKKPVLDIFIYICFTIAIAYLVKTYL